MKGIILAAGYGTRFLPVTKSVPKELLPLIEKPALAFIVEEFLASGIDDILVITSRRKRAIEDYLDREMELESVFRTENDTKKLEKVRPYDARFTFARQQEMRGTGHALLLARSFVGNDPVVVAYPDDLHMGETPLARQLIQSWEETGCSVLATLHDPPELNRYGVLELDEDGLHARNIWEKPAVGEEPSREASIGRFLYTPPFFDYLAEGWEEHRRRGGTGEYFHTPALKRQMEDRRVVYTRTRGERLDTGAPSGYLQAVLRYAAERPELREVIKREAQQL